MTGLFWTNPSYLNIIYKEAGHCAENTTCASALKIRGVGHWAPRNSHSKFAMTYGLRMTSLREALTVEDAGIKTYTLTNRR